MTSLEEKANSPGLRLTSHIIVILAGLAVAPLGWALVQVYNLAMQQMRTNTLALVQNQQAFVELSITLTRIDGRIETNSRSLIRAHENQSKVWTQYEGMRDDLVRLQIQVEGLN